MATEDFTFPINNASRAFLDSPPLWYASSIASPSEEQTNGHQETRNVKTQRRSFSCVEGAVMKRSTTDGGSEEEEDNEVQNSGEEKMDSLWEDFNDEVCKACDIPRLDGNDLGREVIEFGCVPVVANRPPNRRHGAVVSSKKQRAVVLMKVLKKLLLLRHRSHHSVKKRSR
ncbi:hypothetical protein Ancab_036630 [Ancistrocladus abbreviatus]